MKHAPRMLLLQHLGKMDTKGQNVCIQIKYKEAN